MTDHPSIELCRRVAALNPAAGEIGAGMLAQLVQEAQSALSAPPALDMGAVLEMAAKAVEDHQKDGRAWVKGSLWDDLTREAAGRIRRLKAAMLAAAPAAPQAAGVGEAVMVLSGDPFGTGLSEPRLVRAQPQARSGEGK